MLQSKMVKKYDTYKDSGIEWIGKIPQEWEIVTLKRVFSTRDGGAWGEEPQNSKNDKICIRIADFDYSKMTLKHDIDYTIRNYTTDVIAKLTLQKNDILIEKSGGGNQTPVGRTIIFNENFNALYANFIDRLRVKQSISPKFIQYLLVSFYKNGITSQYIKQTTGIQNLDLTNLLEKESIVLPNLDEQLQIADYLDKKCGEIDKVIETEKSVIEKLKEYKQSIITETVTKGLDKSVPLKDSNIEWIGKIPQHWSITKLKHLSISIGDGIHSTPNYDDSGDIYFINGNNIGNDELVYKSDTKKINRLEYENYNKPILNKNTIFIALNGTYGKTSYYNGETVLLGKSAGYITLDNLQNKKYVRYYLQSNIAKYIMDLSLSGTTIANLSLATLKDFLITFPSKEEQQQIAEYLDKKCSEIDKTIVAKEQIIEKFIEYKKSLIYECVTGKRKVVA